MLLQHCFSIFKNNPLVAEFFLDNQVYTIYGVKKTDAGYYQCKATSSQAGVGPIESETVVLIVQEGKWLSCLFFPITGQCMWKRAKSLCTLRGYPYDTRITHSIFIIISLYLFT